MTTESQIQAEIEAARQKISDTQELYREACAILFFRHGITPTANKLYQFVRKGSMSAPAEALARFWEDLREKSRVRIEHPDLPDTLKLAAGEMVASLWSQAQAAAQENLAGFRSEMQAAVAEALAAQASAESERTAALLELGQARQGIQTATERTLVLERDLAAERASNEALSSQLEKAGRQQEALETALTDARRDFSRELEKLRQALQRSEERYEAAEKRALLEIDRERTNAAKVQKEIAQVRQQYQDAEERHRTEVAQLQVDLGNARQETGMTQGMLQEMGVRCEHQIVELQSLRISIVETESKKTLLEQDLSACRGKVAELLKEQASAPKSAPDSRKKRTKPPAI